LKKQWGRELARVEIIKFEHSKRGETDLHITSGRRKKRPKLKSQKNRKATII